ncbi:MAG: response regulator transcription factor [Phycisphaerae bacterium]|nr:response regulator transcription factor [Phycisphaerae bacterium]
MTETEPTVFVVDDDAALCEALQWLLESEGLPVKAYDSAEAFLAEYESGQPGCLVLDVRMRGMSGLELQSKLSEQDFAIPVIIITGHGDVPMAVRAVKAGALEFLEKPVHDQVLLEHIRQALVLDARRRRELEKRSAIHTRMKRLTPREHEVMEHVVAGAANKQIAARLGIKEKTVEVHRRRVMQKMGVQNAVDLVRTVAALQQALR